MFLSIGTEASDRFRNTSFLFLIVSVPLFKYVIALILALVKREC